MGVYIKNWSLADWKELLKWAKIGANNAMIGEFTEVEEVPPHGRLIDADEFLHRAIGTKCFDEDYTRMLQELAGESAAIIPADDKDTDVPIKEEGE